MGRRLPNIPRTSTSAAAATTAVIALFAVGIVAWSDDRGPATIPTTAPGARLKLTDLGRPSTNPAGCAPVRDRVVTLLAELRPKLTAANLTAVEESIKDVQARGQGQADGYSAFAGGALLSGNFTAAAWGGLSALRLQWRSDFVANAGVYLYHLDRLDDAEMFLACARELDPRSPYVIEAQAMLALKRNDCDRAKRLIELAVRLMPGDMNVRYAAGVIHHKCGDRAKAIAYLRAAEQIMPDDETVKRAISVVDPGAAARPRPPDALDRLIAETLAFLDETQARAELASDYYNLVMRALHKGDWTHDEHKLETLREDVERAKLQIRETEKAARDERFGPPDPFQWNQTVHFCAEGYAQVVANYEEVYIGMADALVMGWAMGIDPVDYAQRWGPGGNDLEYVLLDAEEKFDKAIRPLAERAGDCHRIADSRAQHDACDRAFCGDAVGVWQAYRDEVMANCRAAEGGFPRAAEDYANYWVAYVLRVRDFSARAIKILKPTPLMPDIHRQNAEGIANITGVHMDAVIQFTTTVLTDRYESLQRGLDAAPKEVLSAADGPPLGKFRLCPQDGPPGTPMDEKLDPFLEALKAATSVEYGYAGFDCDGKVGAFTVNIKAKSFTDVQVKLSEKVGKISYGASIGTDGRIGGDVSYSQSQSISGYGAAAKATVKLWGKAGAGGRVDYGAQLEGKLGAGVSFKGVEAACYPFSGKVTFNARAFAAALGG